MRPERDRNGGVGPQPQRRLLLASHPSSRRGPPRPHRRRQRRRLCPPPTPQSPQGADPADCAPVALAVPAVPGRRGWHEYGVPHLLAWTPWTWRRRATGPGCPAACAVRAHRRRRTAVRSLRLWRVGPSVSEAWLRQELDCRDGVAVWRPHTATDVPPLPSLCGEVPLAWQRRRSVSHVLAQMNYSEL